MFLCTCMEISVCVSCLILHHFTPCCGARKISFLIFVFYWCSFLLCSVYFRLILLYLCEKAKFIETFLVDCDIECPPSICVRTSVCLIT